MDEMDDTIMTISIWTNASGLQYVIDVICDMYLVYEWTGPTVDTLYAASCI